MVDNKSTDNTVDVKKYGCKVVSESVRRLKVRNTGAKNARGKYFIFLDADTIVSSTLQQAIQALEGEEILCGGSSYVSIIIMEDGFPVGVFLPYGILFPKS